MHRGVHSVAAFDNERYPRHTYRADHLVFAHRCGKWGPQGQAGYKDSIPMLKAHKRDPEAWMDLFEKGGAKYIVPVRERHDGFRMYECSFGGWSAARMGPCRDVVAELERAVRARGKWRQSACSDAASQSHRRRGRMG